MKRCTTSRTSSRKELSLSAHYDTLMTRVVNPHTIKIRMGFNWSNYHLHDMHSAGWESDQSPTLRMAEIDDNNVPQKVQVHGAWKRVTPH